MRVGIVGCADIAWRRLIPAFIATDGVEVTAIASRDPARAERFAVHFGIPHALSYQEVLDSGDIDAVYLPQPPSTRAAMVRQALGTGKHVLAEKPLTTNASQTASLVAMARERGLVLMENFAFLLHSTGQAVRARLAAGAIGEVRHFTGVFTIPPKPAGDIRYQPELGGGVLLDTALYPVRAALDLLGPGLQIAGAVLRVDPDHGVDVAGSVLACTETGVTAALTFGMVHGYRSGYEIHGSLGRLSIERIFAPPAWYQHVLRLETQDHVEQFVLPADDQAVRVVEAFLRAVADPPSAGEWARSSVRQAELIDDIRERAIRFKL